MLSSLNACVIITRVFVTLSSKFEQNVMLFLCRITLRNHIRPHTRLQIKGRKKSRHPPSCVTISTLTPKILYYYPLPLHRTTDVSTSSTNYGYPFIFIMYLQQQHNCLAYQGKHDLLLFFHRRRMVLSLTCWLVRTICSIMRILIVTNVRVMVIILIQDVKSTFVCKSTYWDGHCHCLSKTECW
jgi:hypothetical protein